MLPAAPWPPARRAWADVEAPALAASQVLGGQRSGQQWAWHPPRPPEPSVLFADKAGGFSWEEPEPSQAGAPPALLLQNSERRQVPSQDHAPASLKASAWRMVPPTFLVFHPTKQQFTPPLVPPLGLYLRCALGLECSSSPFGLPRFLIIFLSLSQCHLLQEAFPDSPALALWPGFPFFTCAPTAFRSSCYK